MLLQLLVLKILYLEKLTDKKKLIMKLIQKKIAVISSTGNINFIFLVSKKSNKNKFFIKDNKNSLLSKTPYKFNYFNKSSKYKKNIF